MTPSRPKSDKGTKLIYVIVSKDDSALNSECDKLLGQLLEPTQRATGLVNADPASVTPAELFDELRTLPFLSGRRVVVIRGADGFIKTYREALESYFDNPSPTGVLVLTVNSFPSNTKLAKKLPKIGKLVAVAQPKPWQLPARLREYALDAHNKQLERNCAELLVTLCGDEVTRLYAEIDKLALYAADRGAITIDDVQQLVARGRLYSAFKIIDMVISGDTVAAIEHLRTLFSQDRTAEYTFVGALAFYLRRLFAAKAMLQRGGTEAEVAARLRLWYNKSEFFERLAKTTLPVLGSFIAELGRADFAIKTGRADAKTAAEQFVYKLAAD